MVVVAKVLPCHEVNLIYSGRQHGSVIEVVVGENGSVDTIHAWSKYSLRVGVRVAFPFSRPYIIFSNSNVKKGKEVSALKTKFLERGIILAKIRDGNVPRASG
jgi:hypothetical protein